MEMMKVRLMNFETYALVTGAASGMGRIYAIRLAQRGYSLVLVDINEKGLKETEMIVKEATPEADVVVLRQDLSAEDAAERIFEKTDAAGCVVEILVNNAGIMYCQGLAETSERMLRLIMMVHMYTPLMLCRKFVNGMKQRGRGYILNISSLSAWMIWPGIGMYGCTKRFVKDFSRELRIECQKTGVSVTNAYFGAVDTPMVPINDGCRKVARFSTLMITPEKAVDKALRAMFGRRRSTMPGVLNKLFVPIIRLLPDCLLGWIYRKAKPYLMKV